MATPAADVFAAAGLEPIGPAMRATDETACRCSTCGTTRWVRLSNLRKGGIACRWCHGWTRWRPWSEAARQRAQGWRDVRGSAWVASLLVDALLRPLTDIGDEFTPVGVECLRCGETTVVVPERINLERGWDICTRCSQARRAKVRVDAPDVYAGNGLRLLAPCRGEFVPQPAECLKCGTMRTVSFRRLVDGSAPLCWTCTHGIRPDEPHRVYLVRFPRLGVLKVGLTHARHDRRLEEHAFGGGEIVATLTVPNRAAARALERAVLDTYAPFRTAAVGPDDFPQGGWTETWIDHPEAPACDLRSFALDVISPGENATRSGRSR